MNDLPYDPMLPQLATVLDARAMGVVLGGANCRIERVRYKPGRGALVSYRLGDRLVTARVYPRGCSARRVNAAASCHIDSLGMVAWEYPNDRKLPRLAAFLEQARAGATEFRVVHYVPEQGCTVYVRIGSDEFYAKTYPAGRASAAFATLRDLFAGGAPIPEPVRSEPALEAVWSRAVPGPTLARAVPASAIGAAIARLHRTPAPGVRAQGIADYLARLHEAADSIVAVRPDAATRIERIVDRLERARPRTCATATIHGDLHPKNIIADGDRAWLIDLDALARGPAAADLGSLAAALARPAPDILAAYRREAQAPISRAELAWFTAYALLAERAYRAITRLKPGRLAGVDDLLAAAAEACDA